MPYPETATLGAPPMPMATAMRLELFHELNDDVISLGLGANGLVAGVEFRHWGGAPARPDGDAGPVGHRDAPFSVVVAAMAEDGAQGPALQAAVDKTGDRLAQHATGGSFLNFLGDPAKTPSAYTPGGLPPADGRQARVRPGQLLQREPQHPAGGLAVRG